MRWPRASTRSTSVRDALHTADNVITFKFAVKTMALMRGLHASFMANRSMASAGAGCTPTARSKDGVNAFYDPDAPRQSPRPVCTSSAAS